MSTFGAVADKDLDRFREGGGKADERTLAAAFHDDGVRTAPPTRLAQLERKSQTDEYSDVDSENNEMTIIILQLCCASQEG